MRPPPITRATPTSELKALLKVSEVASWCGCSKGVIYGLIRRGELPAVRLGRLVRIPRGELERFAEGTRTASR